MEVVFGTIFGGKNIKSNLSKGERSFEKSAENSKEVMKIFVCNLALLFKIKFPSLIPYKEYVSEINVVLINNL